MFATFLTIAILFINFTGNSNKELNSEKLYNSLSGYNSEIENLKKIDFPPLDEGNFEMILENNQLVENSDSKLFILNGKASHYARKFHGRKTANGETFDMNDFSAAHKSLPFGTILKVINQKNGKSTLVRVNDRGPYSHNRIIDLSYSAAKKIGNLGIPKIKAIGFDAETLINTDPNSQFLAFSSDKKFQILDKGLTSIKYTCEDFTEAINFYIKLKENSKLNNVYIFVPASKEYYNTNEYFVGSIESNALFASFN